jgi:hypothetical protein
MGNNARIDERKKRIQKDLLKTEMKALKRRIGKQLQFQ